MAVPGAPRLVLLCGGDIAVGMPWLMPMLIAG